MTRNYVQQACLTHPCCRQSAYADRSWRLSTQLSRRAAHVLVACVLTVVVGCSSESQDEPDQPEDTPAIEKKTGAGPVRFTLELSEDQITTADALMLRMILDVSDTYEAEFPDIVLAQDVPELIVTHFDEQVHDRPGGRRIERVYEVEPALAGTIELPAMEVYYNRKDEIDEHRLDITATKIEVEPASDESLDASFGSMRDLVQAREIVEAEQSHWSWIGAVLGAVALLIVVIVLLARRRKTAPPPMPPHELAMEQLRDLESRRLIASGQFEQFFVEITGIVREYIERAFGLRAPEQTTEEFLAQLSSNTQVAAHRDTLQPFLRAADEVKFARQQADEETMQRAFATARAFVQQTSSTSDTRRANT